MNGSGRTERLAQLNTELKQARESREYYSRVASEQQDQSYEPGTEGQRMACRAAAASYRQTAGRFAQRILDIGREIASLEAAPALVTAAQAHDQDDTMNFRVAVA